MEDENVLDEGKGAVTVIELRHRRVLRWLHWLNLPVLAVMVLSGIYIYWAYPVYRIGVGDVTLIPMNLSRSAWHALGVNNNLAFGMALHFAFGWLFVLIGIAYVLTLVVTGDWRRVLPRRGTFRDAWHVLLHDFRLRKEAPPADGYNGAQRLAYTGVVFMACGQVVTGLAIYKPVQLGWVVALLGGYRFARFLHFWLMIGLCFFFVVHVVQVARAGWNNLRGMITGWQVVQRPASGGDDA